MADAAGSLAFVGELGATDAHTIEVAGLTIQVNWRSFTGTIDGFPRRAGAGLVPGRQAACRGQAIRGAGP